MTTKRDKAEQKQGNHWNRIPPNTLEKQGLGLSSVIGSEFMLEAFRRTVDNSLCAVESADARV